MAAADKFTAQGLALIAALLTYAAACWLGHRLTHRGNH